MTARSSGTEKASSSVTAGYDAADVDVAFPFGFGLSTLAACSGMSVDRDVLDELVGRWRQRATGR